VLHAVELVRRLAVHRLARVDSRGAVVSPRLLAGAVTRAFFAARRHHGDVILRILILSEAGPINGVLDLEKEAQVTALCRQIPADNLTFDVMSNDPTDTAARHGVHAIRRLGFGDADGAINWNRRRHAILSAATGTPNILQWQDQAWQVIQAVIASDLVLIGGAEISIRSQHFIYECATLMDLAVRFRKPLFLGALSISPLPEGPERQLVAELLRSSVIVGARDWATFDLVRELGIERDHHLRTVDDTAFVGIDDPTATDVADRYVVAAVSPETGEIPRELFARSVAALLDHAARRTKLRVVLPIFADPVDGELDREVDGAENDLRRAILLHTTSGRVEGIETSSVADAAGLARGAALVISSEYQFALFGAAAGVPTIGIGTNDLSDRRISNVLEDFGQYDSVLPAVALGTPDATRLVDDVWKHRAVIRTNGVSAVDIRKTEKNEWWKQTTLPPRAGRFGFAAIDRSEVLSPALAVRLSALRDRTTASSPVGTVSARVVTKTVAELRYEASVAETRARAASIELETLRARIAELAAENRSTTDRSVEFEAELRATLATKTFRYSDRLRSVYRRLRR
jgi:polysaccharide pyruvyl transferase WcaK-like protein